MKEYAFAYDHILRRAILRTTFFTIRDIPVSDIDALVGRTVKLLIFLNFNVLGRFG
jgi:hypothetical protein